MMPMNAKCIAVAAIAAVTTLPTMAQRNEVKAPRIASVQVVAGDDWLSPPIATLNGSDPINISFDDLTHVYHRYAYTLEHCEADWSPSDELFASDYCEGFAEGNIIDDVTESINTNTLYTHYRLQIPNDKCRPTMSGNYKLHIYDENDGDTVLTACFMLCEPLVAVSMEATTNTDIDTNKSHQQISFGVNYGNLRITNFEKEISTTVMQNGRRDNAVINPKPQYLTPDGARWEHNRDLIFDGGNEYRKFEALDVTHTTMGLEHVEWDGANFHAYVWTDEPRPNYTYDEDANGSFYIRNSDNIENDYISEYVYVHFRLKTPRQNGEIYINGAWTDNRFLPKYHMEYNALNNQYEATLLLKQGYYSYQYLVDDGNGKGRPVQSEGNFFQTENNYQTLVYYKGIGQRATRLVGYKQLCLK